MTLVSSKVIWDSYPDKTTYKWLSSGIHIYNVLKRLEQDNERARKDKQDERVSKVQRKR